MEDFKLITSRENSLIKLVSVLQSSPKARRENGLFVIEGLRIAYDAMENGIRFDKLILSETAFNKYESAAADFLKNSSEKYIVPDSLFKKLSDTSSPQGICVVAALPDTKADVINPNGRYVILENVADPSNLGAVARTAEALGVNGIILNRGGCDPYSPKSLRASMGALLRLPLIITDNIAGTLKASQLVAFACVVDKNAESIKNIGFCDGCAVIIGNEANGITEELKSFADKLITIPMRGRVESFNAAAAAAIAMWEMMK